MKRPFVTLCIFLFTGIMVSHLFNYFIPMYYVMFSVLLALISIPVYEKAFNILLLAAVIILGIHLYGQSVVGDNLLEGLPPSSIMRIKILKEGSPGKGCNEYEVEIINIFADEKSKGIKINRKAQLNIYQFSAKDFMPAVGDIVEIRNADARKLLRDYKKGTVDGYELFLKSKGLEYILNADAGDITKIDINFGHTEILDRSYKAKTYLEDFLDSTLDFENSNILKSVIFGNRGYLSRDRLDVFARTGTAHIMAVSGLHIGLMVVIMDRFLRLLKIGKNGRIYFTAAILIFYGYMVYFPVSIVRAGLMYLLYVIAYFLQRRYDSINALFFIGFILLICRPLAIFSVSFQLSFMATLGILLLGPVLNDKLNKIIGPLSPLVSVTLAAQIGTLPIMAYHFNQISLISLITNLLIVPMILPVLSITFVSTLVGVISFKSGFLINRITNHILNYIDLVAVKCAAIPFGSFEIVGVEPVHILGYYTILALICFLLCKKDGFKGERLVKTYEL